MNPSLGLSKRQARPKKFSSGTKQTKAANTQRFEEDNDEDGLDDDDEEEQEDEDAEGDPEQDSLAANTPAASKPAATQKPQHTIQILELQSKNPIIAYRGHVFSCTWAENIGTELLFAEHDSTNPLPTLRTLPNDLDILAACSARLVSNTVIMQPKSKSATEAKESAGKFAPQMKGPESFPLKKANPQKGRGPVPIIKIDKHASDTRKKQARFLEKVMMAKQSRGEKDEVSVHVEKRQKHMVWLDHIEQRREERRAQLTRDKKKGGHRGEAAARQLREMDEEDAGREKPSILARGIKRKSVGRGRSGKRARSSAGRSSAGRGRTRTAKGSFLEREEEIDFKGHQKGNNINLDDEDSSVPQERLHAPLGIWTEQPTLSAPTPKSWSELELHDEDAEGELYDEDEAMED